MNLPHVYCSVPELIKAWHTAQENWLEAKQVNLPHVWSSRMDLGPAYSPGEWMNLSHVWSSRLDGCLAYSPGEQVNLPHVYCSVPEWIKAWHYGPGE